MDSFNDASFVSSRKANTVSFETIPAEVKDRPKEETVEYGVMDADQLRVQLELTGKKLKLTQDLQEQIKEQQKVLRKQVCWSPLVTIYHLTYPENQRVS